MHREQNTHSPLSLSLSDHLQMWINPCAQVIFDSDPAPKDVSGPAGVDMMSQAMIRCVCVLCLTVCSSVQTECADELVPREHVVVVISVCLQGYDG